MSEKEWAFDRYRDGVRMAQGCRVHASTKDEAIQKARQLFDYEDCTFVERAEPSPEPEAAPTECLCDEYGKDLCAIHNVDPEAAPASEPQQDNKHSIQIRPISSRRAIEGLTRIFGDLQHDFHDQWDWMNAEFYLNILCAELDKLRARVAILDAQEAKLPDLDVTECDLGKAIGWMAAAYVPSEGTLQAFAEYLACRERQLLDSQRAVQAKNELLRIASEEVQERRNLNGLPPLDHIGRWEHKLQLAYDALAGKGE